VKPELEIVVLYCQRTLPEKADLDSLLKRPSPFRLRLVALPCSSKVQTPHLLKILEQGAQGVLVVACPETACRFLVGSGRVRNRIDYVRGLLDQAGVGAWRIGLLQGSDIEAEDLWAAAMEVGADPAV